MHALPGIVNVVLLVKNQIILKVKLFGESEKNGFYP